MRIKYLKSVLRQEVGFFDSQTADSSITYQVVSTLSSDANTIQAVIGEKVSVLPYFLVLFKEKKMKTVIGNGFLRQRKSF